MYTKQFKQLVTDTLHAIGRYSPEAVELLMGTCAQESRLGYFMKQVGKGPALGCMQIEPYTYKDLLLYLDRHEALSGAILSACGMTKHEKESLVFNVKYSICMARVFYLRKRGAIPKDLYAQGRYYKKHYNTYLGSASIPDYIRNYKKYGRCK